MEISAEIIIICMDCKSTDVPHSIKKTKGAYILEVGPCQNCEPNPAIALKEIQKYNNLHNDLDTYLFEIAEWGLGIRVIKPSPVDYSLETGS